VISKKIIGEIDSLERAVRGTFWTPYENFNGTYAVVAPMHDHGTGIAQDLNHDEALFICLMRNNIRKLIEHNMSF